MIRRLLLFLLVVPFGLNAQEAGERQHYVAYRSSMPLEMDGSLSESDWEKAQWTDLFVDIEGAAKPAPLYDTKLKMLWDEQHLYIGVWMEEPDLWAIYTERELVIFHQNDIEFFLDPDGDTHNYYELEINALGTEWDLMITKPYKNGGQAINGWNINGLQTGISLQGTVNDPSDRDTSWTVEIAIPWKAIATKRGNAAPRNGEQWRVNFSRVQWQLEVEDGKYVKKVDPATGKSFPEYNWVWSPQGHINMHLPEYWGYVQFAEEQVGKDEVAFELHEDEKVKDALRKLYNLQKAYWRENGKYANKLSSLPGASSFQQFQPQFEVSATRFKLSAPSLETGQTWYITEDSRIWLE